MKKKNLSILLLVSVMLSGCMSFFEDAPEVKSIPIQQAPNPTTLDVAVIASNTKTPIAVHFFQLETDEYFKRLDYFELMKEKRSKLKGEIIRQSKKTLRPSQMEKFHVRPSENVRYFAVVAGFKDVQSNDNWRFIQEIVPERKNDITLILSQNNMQKVNNVPSNSAEQQESKKPNNKLQINEDTLQKTVEDAAMKKAEKSIGSILK